MNSSAPPAADDDDAYVFVDHRELESSIIRYVAERLAPEHALSAREDGEELFVTYRGREHRIPPTISPHDRYLAISSLAELMKDDYRFFVLLPSHDTDTHGLLVVPNARAHAWGPLPEHLAPLQLGFDYFRGISIPYLNHEGSAANFANESEADAFSRLVLSGVITGRVDPNAVAALAKDAMTNPNVREHPDFLKGTSEAETAAEIQKAIDEKLQHPDVRKLRGEIDGLMAGMQAEVQAVIRSAMQPKKPWWKFW